MRSRLFSTKNRIDSSLAAGGLSIGIKTRAKIAVDNSTSIQDIIAG
jgi:hypothetical protein